MRTLMIVAALTVLLGGCAAMPSAQLAECLQPNRRVGVEVGGSAPKPLPNPKPRDRPAAKPSSPGSVPVSVNALLQGNSAFDFGAAALKDGGKAELDQLMAAITKRNVGVGSVVVVGHVDRLEAESSPASLSEDRAKSVVAYLTGKGVDQKLMFWEGKGAMEPLPVTKFCE